MKNIFPKGKHSYKFVFLRYISYNKSTREKKVENGGEMMLLLGELCSTIYVPNKGIIEKTTSAEKCLPPTKNSCNIFYIAVKFQYLADNMSSYTSGTPHDINYSAQAKISGFINQDNVEVGGLLIKNQVCFLSTCCHN